MTGFIYPSQDTSRIVTTDYIDGVRFDIHEVLSEYYDRLASPRSRFYLTCEDLIVGCGMDSAIDYYKATKETRWGFFCDEKNMLVDKVSKFEKILAEYKQAKQRCTTEAFKVRYEPEYEKIRNYVMKIYGYKLV